MPMSRGFFASVMITLQCLLYPGLTGIYAFTPFYNSHKILGVSFKELEMRGPGVPSLDQLTVFLTVVETGSFAAAGRRLGRATSAVSYAIANLEQQLGVQLFDRDQARRPALTEAGTAVLSEARSVSVGVDNLRAKVKGLLDGLEAQIALAVDVMLPTARLVDAMRAFEATFPTVTLRLYVEALGSGDPTRPFRHCRYRHQRSGCDPSGHRTDQGWRCGTHSCGSAEPPIGGGSARMHREQRGTLCNSCSAIALH